MSTAIDIDAGSVQQGLQQTIKNLPNLPGIYRMLNAQGEVIYIGKAKDLKKRVASYFGKQASNHRTAKMISQVSQISVMVTHSETDALILESNLIKQFKPRYNVLFKDDKSYPYIVISADNFPRLSTYRGSLASNKTHFGPFPSSGSVKESIHLLKKVFKLRTCSNSIFNNRTRPCLEYQIQLCSAPCVDFISASDYQESVKQAELFLKGKTTEIIQDMTKHMEQLSISQDFEQAAVMRDRVRALHQIQAKQLVSDTHIDSADVVSCVSINHQYAVNLLMIRGSRHIGDANYFPQHPVEADEKSILQAFLMQHYVSHNVPAQIIINKTLDTVLLTEALQGSTQRKIAIHICHKGNQRLWLKMSETNARIALQQRINTRQRQEQRLAMLCDALSLPHNTSRIECFDISHTMGEATVASCVVFERNAMQTNAYRRYNIQNIVAGDDYAAMREVLYRRYQKISEGDGIRPQLILIDGGIGQVNVACSVLHELDWDDIPIIGIAKGETRKSGQETLIIARTNSTLKLPAEHAGFHLIQEIRDEAHRFAISGHRNRRQQTRLTSRLDDITGIGTQKRKALLAYFGSLSRVKSASIEELTQVAGISVQLAEKIYRELH